MSEMPPEPIHPEQPEPIGAYGTEDFAANVAGRFAAPGEIPDNRRPTRFDGGVQGNQSEYYE